MGKLVQIIEAQTERKCCALVVFFVKSATERSRAQKTTFVLIMRFNNLLYLPQKGTHCDIGEIIGTQTHTLQFQ